METFDLIVIMGGLCGLAMVIGGIFLLYTGALTLKERSEGGALSVEFEKRLKVSFQYPGLAFFFIGLVFVGLTMWFSQPDPISPMSVVGTVEAEDLSSVKILLSSKHGTLEPLTDGTVDELVFPNVGRIKVEITAPGRNPVTRVINTIGGGSRTIDIGRVVLGEAVVRKDEARGKIKDLGSIELPALADSGAFD